MVFLNFISSAIIIILFAQIVEQLEWRMLRIQLSKYIPHKYQLMKVGSSKVYYNKSNSCSYTIWEDTISSMMQVRMHLCWFSINLCMIMQEIMNKNIIIPSRSRVLRNLLLTPLWEVAKIVYCSIFLLF